MPLFEFRKLSSHRGFPLDDGYTVRSVWQVDHPCCLYGINKTFRAVGLFRSRIWKQILCHTWTRGNCHGWTLNGGPGIARMGWRYSRPLTSPGIRCRVITNTGWRVCLRVIKPQYQELRFPLICPYLETGWVRRLSGVVEAPFATIDIFGTEEPQLLADEMSEAAYLVGLYAC